MFAGAGSGLRSGPVASSSDARPSGGVFEEEEEEGAGVCFEEAGLVRAYTMWPTENTFCCWGFCMTGPEADCSPNMCAWMMVLLPMVIFFYLWEDVLEESSRPALCAVSACFVSTIVWFLATSFTDPGIIARNPDRCQAAPATALSQGQGGRRHDAHRHVVLDLLDLPPAARVALQRLRQLRSRFRPPLPFTRNCIGGRNYPFFLLFLLSVSFSLGALLVSCLLLGNGPPPPRAGIEPEVGQTLNVFLMLFAVFLSLIMWGFTGYHVSLVLSGLTTKEHVKGRKNGAKRMDVCQRLGRCACQPPSGSTHALSPRPACARGAYPTIPVISHEQL